MIDKIFIESIVRTSERAAYGASLHKGKGDKIAADQAAVDEMRNQLNKSWWIKRIKTLLIIFNLWYWTRRNK